MRVAVDAERGRNSSAHAPWRSVGREQWGHDAATADTRRFNMYGASDAAQAIRKCSGGSYGAGIFLSAPRNRRLHQQQHGSETRQNAGTYCAYDGLHCLMGALERGRKGEVEGRINFAFKTRLRPTTELSLALPRATPPKLWGAQTGTSCQPVLCKVRARLHPRPHCGRPGCQQRHLELWTASRQRRRAQNHHPARAPCFRVLDFATRPARDPAPA